MNQYELMGFTKEEAAVFQEIEQQTGYDFAYDIASVASALMHDRYLQPIGDIEDLWFEMEMDAAKPWVISALWMVLITITVVLL